MQIVKSIADLRLVLKGERSTLVPTMGNLHAGHLSLVRLAQDRGDCVVTSIFVNPLQFAPHEDFDRYPRTLEHDCHLLKDAGCDIVFAPSQEVIYPGPQEYKVIPPPALAGILEGAVRPGFFTGVCTVVLKLFHIVQPVAAVFGKKDYQQLLVVREMVRQLALPVTIIGAEIVRESSGLALSSRNGYLSAAEREEAPQLNVVLREAASAARLSLADFHLLEWIACESLVARGWQPDYVAVRRRADLGLPSPEDELIVLGAARLGETRIIDNVEP